VGLERRMREDRSMIKADRTPDLTRRLRDFEPVWSRPGGYPTGLAGI